MVVTRPYNFTAFDDFDKNSAIAPKPVASSFVPDHSAKEIKDVTFEDFTLSDAPKEATYTEEELKNREVASFEKGVLSGKEQFNAEMAVLEKQTSLSLGKISDKLQQLNVSAISMQGEQSNYLVNLAVAVAKKIADKALLENYVQVTEDTITECLKLIRKEPMLIIKVSDEIADNLSSKIDKIIRQVNFDGQVSVVSTENVALGDCVLQWEEGGLEVNMADKKQQIDKILSSL